MKQMILLLLTLSVTCFLSLNARVALTPTEACATALDIADEQDASNTAQFSNVVMTKFSDIDGTTPVLYVVNTYNRSLTRGHFVIMDAISGTLLAYGDGLLDENNVPEAMQELLVYYQEQIDYLLTHDNMSSGTNSPSLNFSQDRVSPLLSTKWGQGPPYNLKCPLDSAGNRCVTGCGAVAVAQVMKKWHYPQGNVDAIPGYITGNIVVEDLPETQFDWDNMLDSYAGNDTTAQAQAVATLMRYAGQAQETTYGNYWSGSAPDRIKDALNSFGYNSSKWVKAEKDSAAWFEKMMSELYTGRPIIYYAVADKGHIFVVDGCKCEDSRVLFHINWGWYGSDQNTKINSNGYFLLNNFTGLDNVYNINQQMIVDIIPIDSLPPEVTVDSTALSFEEFTGYIQQQSFKVRGNWLKQNIELSLSGDDNGMFSITPTTITPEEAERGVDVTVKFTPTWPAGETSAIVNIESETGLFTVDLSGKAILSETIIDIEEQNISFIDGHTGYAQEKTFNVTARIYYMLDGDTTTYSVPLRNNVVLSMESQGLDCPFAISSRTITPKQAFKGFPVTVTYDPKEDGESTANLILSTPLGAEGGNVEQYVLNLYGNASSEPCIRVDTPSLSFNNWHTHYEKTDTIIVSAYHVMGDIELSLDNPFGPFTVSRTTIPADSAGMGMPVIVTYYPQEEGHHSTSLALTNPGNPNVDVVTLNISGDANSDPCIQVNTSSLSFDEYTGYLQTKTFTLNAYNLTDDVRLILYGHGTDRAHFTVVPDVVSKAEAEQGAIVSVSYRPSVDLVEHHLVADHFAQINLSSSGEYYVGMLMLDGHALLSLSYLSADTTALSLNTIVGQPVSKSIIVNKRRHFEPDDSGADDMLNTDNENDYQDGSVGINLPSWVVIPKDDLQREIPFYAILDGDDGFELDASVFYYKNIEKLVYVIGDMQMTSLAEQTDTVAVIFNPKDNNQLARNASITFYATGAKPLKVSLNGTIEVNQKRGDINGDGIVDVSDVTMLISMVLGGTPADLSVADLTGDGELDVSDVTALIALVLSN